MGFRLVKLLPPHCVEARSLWFCWLRRKRAATRFGYRGRCGRLVRSVLACSRLTVRVMEAVGGAFMLFGELVSANRTKVKIAITFYQIVSSQKLNVLPSSFPTRVLFKVVSMMLVAKC